MVRIWISRQSTIPVREQLSAQLRFGIPSGRLAAAERLPSVRELARRLKIHPNTVGAAYQDLAAGGWVTSKSGSGVFVSDIKHGLGRDGIADFVDMWIEEGLSRGYTLAAIRAQFEKAEAAPHLRGFIAVHADPEFAHILAAEVEEAAGVPIASAVPADLSLPDFERRRILATVSAAAAVSQVRSDGHTVIPLKTVEQMLAGVRIPRAPFLVAVVSRSESILKWASLLITALGGSGNDVIARNPSQPKWKDGLAACDLVAADVLSAKELPKQIQPVVLRLVPEAFFEEIRRLVTVEKA